MEPSPHQATPPEPRTERPIADVVKDIVTSAAEQQVATPPAAAPRLPFIDLDV